MLVPKAATWQYKLKRVLKYIIVLLLVMFFGTLADVIIAHWIKDPFLTFKEDWLILYGAMCYRIVSTWEYKH